MDPEQGHQMPLARHCIVDYATEDKTTNRGNLVGCARRTKAWTREGAVGRNMQSFPAVVARRCWLVARMGRSSPLRQLGQHP